jgi:hypothetical protein
VIVFILIIRNSLSGQQSELLSASAGHFTSTNYQITWSIGEPLIETYNSANLIVNQGFHQNLSHIVNLNNLDAEYYKLSIYPVPAGNTLYLLINPKNPETFDYTIFNQNGKRLFGAGLSTLENQLDISNLVPGIYFIQITNKNRTHCKTYNFIKI